MMQTDNRKSHRSLCLMLILGTLAVPLVLSSETQAENPWVKWERIEGVIVSGNAIENLNVVAGVESVAFSWSTTMGKAKVNLSTGKAHFWVKGLVLASQIPRGGPLVIGVPSPAVKAVKGTIVCNATDPFPFSNAVLVDTDLVPLSLQGDAQFQGEVNLPVVCDNMAFLIRVADGVLVNRWVAYGAVRSP
jgi:hypothetical protein